MHGRPVSSAEGSKTACAAAARELLHWTGRSDAVRGHGYRSQSDMLDAVDLLFASPTTGGIPWATSLRRPMTDRGSRTRRRRARRRPRPPPRRLRVRPFRSGKASRPPADEARAGRSARDRRADALALRPARGGVSRRHARSRREPERRGAVAMHRGPAALRGARSRLRAGPRSRHVHEARPSRDRARRSRALRRDGARRQRVHRVAAGLPRAGSAGAILRRSLRECRAVPCPLPGAAARAWPAARYAPARGRPVQLQPARRERRGLESRSLRRPPRSRSVARLPVGGGVRRARALLPTRRVAARTTALAGDRLAQGGRLPREPHPARTTGPRRKERVKLQTGRPMDLLGGASWRSSPACRSARWC